MKEVYIKFIQYSLDDSKLVPDGFEKIDWQYFIKFCYQHSILGIVFAGLERANKKIPEDVLFEWISYVENIKRQNLIVNNRIQSISKWFEEKGYRSVILKGQANGLMYPHPELRSPGDIDIWVDAPIMDLIRIVQKKCPDADCSIHHIKMPVFNDVSIEVHYRPIYLINWFADKKLQKHISAIKDKEFSNRVKLNGKMIGCLTDEFNAVYQLLHMYAHFFSTRNNFKQLIDYFYLLKQGFTDNQKAQCKELIERFGIVEYAQGVMWIQREILGLDEKMLIFNPDKIVGEIILKETLLYGSYTNDGVIALLKQFLSNLRLVRFFSLGVILSPFFLVWHQWWKYKMKWSVRHIV